MTPPLWQKVKRNEMSLLMKMKESEKADLKFNIQKTQIMASSPITSWQIDEETMETVRDSDCSHEVKSHLPLARKAITNLDSILKSRPCQQRSV